MRDDRVNIIVQKSFQFALTIVEFCEILEKKRKYVIARQLLKSGTIIGTNKREAQNAESKINYLHKLKITPNQAISTFSHFQINPLAHQFIFKFSN